VSLGNHQVAALLQDAAPPKSPNMATFRPKSEEY